MPSNSWEADQDIAPSGTNLQIGTPSNDVPVEKEIPAPWSITKSHNSSNRIELIFH